MIDKIKCSPGVIVNVNEKKTKWNIDLGSRNNGLVAFEGATLTSVGGMQFEISPNTKLELLSKVKKINNCNLVIFKIVGDSKIFNSYWCSFKHKVDL